MYWHMSEVARVTACSNQQQEGGWVRVHVCVMGRGMEGKRVVGIEKKEKKTGLGENILLLPLRERSYLSK